MGRGIHDQEIGLLFRAVIAISCSQLVDRLRDRTQPPANRCRVKMAGAWSYTSKSSYVWMAWFLFKHGHKLALILVEHFSHNLSDILGRQQYCNLDFLPTGNHRACLVRKSGCMLVSLCVLDVIWRHTVGSEIGCCSVSACLHDVLTCTNSRAVWRGSRTDLHW